MQPARSAGFTLLEVVVALAILAVVLVSLPQVLLQSARSAAAAQRVFLASTAASEKLEQLRGLGWAFDSSGTRVEDLQSDVSRSPVAPGGGLGLALSPPGSLDSDVPGFVDYLDYEGRWLGAAGPPPGGTRFVRRWSVDQLPDGPADTLLLRVRVLLWTPGAGPGGRASEAARLATLKSRRPL